MTVLTMKTESEFTLKMKAKFIAYFATRFIFVVLMAPILYYVLEYLELENETWNKIINSFVEASKISDAQTLLILVVTFAPELATRFCFTIKYLAPYIWKLFVIVTFVLKHLLTNRCTCHVKIFVEIIRESVALPDESKSLRHLRKKKKRRNIPKNNRQTNFREF